MDYFVPENIIINSKKEFLSPSGKYKLIVAHYKTTKDGWSYSQGLVYKKDCDELIVEIKRNYCSFPYLFVENHSNGHDYLVAGADYQGQTIIELDTGKRRDLLPEEAKKGAGFCWAEYKFYPDSSLLIVCGCFWACPYEFRFYNFSDPMAGWPEIKMESYVDADDKWPSVEGGIIRCFETSEENNEKSIKTFHRDGNKLVLIDEWVSDKEKEDRRKREEANRLYEQWKVEFRATDPLYLTFKSRLNDPGLNPSDYESVGVTYDDWCPTFKGNEQRWCKRLVEGHSNGITVDLEWAVMTGPIKLVIYKGGKHIDDKFFAHSVEGMNEAFDFVLLSEAQRRSFIALGFEEPSEDQLARNRLAEELRKQNEWKQNE